MCPLKKMVKTGGLLLLIAGILLVAACETPVSKKKKDIIPLDKTSLNDKIVEAQTLFDSLAESVDGTDVDKNSYWVSSTEKWALECAIETAQEIAASSDVAAKEIQLALDALTKAYNTANDAKKAGTKGGTGNNNEPSHNPGGQPGNEPGDNGETDAAVSYTFNGPQDETITLSAAQTLSWLNDDTLHITVAEEFAAYQWYVDGIIRGETGNSITLSAREFTLTIHTVTLKVTKGGVPYTKTLTFTVE